MKKLIASLLVIVSLLTVAFPAVADTYYRTEYTGTQYLVCGGDDHECFTAIVDIFTLAEMASRNEVCSAYGIDVDGTYEICWSFSPDGRTFTTFLLRDMTTAIESCELY